MTSAVRRPKPDPTKRARNGRRPARRPLAKAPTGIAGLDEITNGGLPRGRPTLVCGGAGCGKTLLAMEFLVRGALEHGEPGVFMSFEETPADLVENARSLGFDLARLRARRRLLLDYVRLERSELTETGEYDLEGLFIRLGHAIDSIGAKRVVLDTIETLFSGLSDRFVVRAELARLFRWLKTKEVTAIVTGEREAEHLTRHGLEEYVSDCVILLDQRVREQSATRRLRILKYRGSAHGGNEVPFLIDDHGVSVLPITSLGLTHQATTAHLSTGVPGLDAMFAREGYFRGNSVLASGTAGTGKSSLAAHFVEAACRRGERCLYFAFEESPSQIARNMRSIGIDLEPWMRRGLLQVHAQRPTALGLEAHLVAMHRLIDACQPQVVVVDPVTNLIAVGSEIEVKAMLARLIDFMKLRQITALFTSLTEGGGAAEQTDLGVSSLMDVWMLLGNLEANGERNRAIQIVKARGMAHSNQVREFLMTDRGIVLLDVSRRADGSVAIGSARDARREQAPADDRPAARRRGVE
ncbi:MAG TPA: circadian clock protein KaiC [Gemmatimonadales bacterium]|jgi:circadian clock protein KaiC|nr:circadian clock protein KaiC [Gemmatimonadales bacterium]